MKPKSLSTLKELSITAQKLIQRIYPPNPGPVGALKPSTDSRDQVEPFPITLRLEPALRVHAYAFTYLLILFALGAIDGRGWLFTFAATPLFYLIPLGLGLFLLTLLGGSLQLHLERHSAVILGATVGFAFLPSIAETATHFVPNAAYVLYGLMVLAYIGLFRARSLFRIVAEERRETAVMAAVVLATCAAAWWVEQGIFFHFPFADLFAETQKMKGAVQFADTGYVNSDVASYGPLKEVLSGGLLAAVGLDILKSHWTLGFYSSVYSAIAVMGFVALIFPEKQQRWIALPLLVSCLVFVPTNGGLANVASLLLLGLLIASTKTGPFATANRRRKILGAIAVPLLVILAMRAPPPMALTFVVLLPWLAARSTRIFDGIPSLFVAPLLLACASGLLHRGALLSNAIAVTLWILYLLCTGLRGRLTRNLSIAVWMSMALLPIVAFVSATLVAAAKFEIIDFDLDRLFLYPYSLITRFVFGQTIALNNEIGLGFGATNALLELVRSIGPLTAIIVGTSAGVWLLRTLPSRMVQQTSMLKSHADQVLMTIWAWSASIALLLFQLSGFPFAYRSSNLVLALLFVALGGFISTRSDRNGRVKIPPFCYVIGTLAVALFLMLDIGLYGLWPVPGTTSYGYQVLQRPALLSMVIGSVGALFVLYAGTAYRTKVWALVAVFALCTGGDRAGVTIRLMPHSYGPQGNKISAVSHYTAEDIAVAHWMRAATQRSLLISDPYTLAITKALTGNPGIYLFSNLDTMNPETGRLIKSLIASAIESRQPGRPASRREFCWRLMQPLSILNGEAFAQIMRDQTNVFEKSLGDIWRSSAQQRSATSEAVQLLPFRLPEAREADWDFDADHVRPEDRIGDSKFGVSLHLLKAFHNKAANAWTILLLLNERTLRWIATKPYERLGYFPRDVKLGENLVSTLRANDFKILHNEKGKSLVVDVNCFIGRRS